MDIQPYRTQLDGAIAWIIRQGYVSWRIQRYGMFVDLYAVGMYGGYEHKIDTFCDDPQYPSQKRKY